jgi:hypothetical protein
MQLCSKAIIVVISRIKLATDTEGLRGAGGAPVFGRHVVGSSLVPCRAALEQMKYCEMLYGTLYLDVPLEARCDGSPRAPSWVCTAHGYVDIGHWHGR